MTMGLCLTQNSTCLHHLLKATQQGILGFTFTYQDLRRHNTPTHSRDIHRPNISSPCMSTISNQFIWPVYFFDSNHYSTLAYHHVVQTVLRYLYHNRRMLRETSRVVTWSHYFRNDPLSLLDGTRDNAWVHSVSHEMSRTLARQP